MVLCLLKMFSHPREIEILLADVESDQRITNHKMNMPDAEGRSSKLALWTDMQQDLWGAVTGDSRLAESPRGYCVMMFTIGTAK